MKRAIVATAILTVVGIAQADECVRTEFAELQAMTDSQLRDYYYQQLNIGTSWLGDTQHSWGESHKQIDACNRETERVSRIMNDRHADRLAKSQAQNFGPGLKDVAPQYLQK